MARHDAALSLSRISSSAASVTFLVHRYIAKQLPDIMAMQLKHLAALSLLHCADALAPPQI